MLNELKKNNLYAPDTFFVSFIRFKMMHPGWNDFRKWWSTLFLLNLWEKFTNHLWRMMIMNAIAYLKGVNQYKVTATNKYHIKSQLDECKKFFRWFKEVYIVGTIELYQQNFQISKTCPHTIGLPHPTKSKLWLPKVQN